MSTYREFCSNLNIDLPLICGAMYPCSNPELVAAVSEAGGIGMIQPLSLTYVHGHDFREGLRYIRTLTKKPVGLNLVVERSSKKYLSRLQEWVDIAIEEKIEFFVTALGNPRWVVEKAHPAGITVYHNTTNRKWAQKALDGGVDGLIGVNNRAGGHAGTLSPEQLYEELADFGKPVICAGGVSRPEDFIRYIEMGYAGVQMGTRFIASAECSAHPDYKQAILEAEEADIVLTEKISGVPVSIIKTPHIERTGTKAGRVARLMLKGRRTKKWMRAIYTLQSLWQLKRASIQGMTYKDYFQAGKSVSGIEHVQTVNDIISEYAGAMEKLKQ